MHGTQFPTEMLTLGLPINPVVCNGILLVAIQLRRSSNHHPQGKTWGQGLTIIILLILALTRQPMSASGCGDCPSESILTLKPLQHEGQPEVWKGCSHCAQNCSQEGSQLWKGASLLGLSSGASPLPASVSYCPLGPLTLPLLKWCRFKLQAMPAPAFGPQPPHW